jgi:hypothetical protein
MVKRAMAAMREPRWSQFQSPLKINKKRKSQKIQNTPASAVHLMSLGRGSDRVADLRAKSDSWY